MNNIVVRTLSGAVFIVLILGSVLLSTNAMIICLGLFSTLGLMEFFNFFKASEIISVSKPLGIFVGLSIFVLFASIFMDLIPLTLVMAIVFVLIFSLFLTEIWRKKQNPLFNIGVYTSSYLYVIVPFLILILIALLYGKIVLATMFVLIWTNDTFAYLSGRFFGKTKLFPRISPNKTWEGTVGGMIFTMIMALVIANFTDHNFLLWGISAVIISICANLGDLLESLFKRSLNLKDSGNIMPGHGGILDRFDAAIFAAPFFYCWLVIYSYF